MQRAQGVLEEIVVTASKRETSLQDTALSVSAITGEELKRLGITNFSQILGSIPGATVVEAGPGQTRVSFRGVATDPTVRGNSTTSSYINEFPLGVGATELDIKLVDMAQFEVLKGPQGTLYGQSAMGGVMRYITNKPSTEAVEGGIDVAHESVASGDSGYRTQGFINVPLSDSVAVRAVFYNYDNAGFIDNLGTGTDDINSEEVVGGRIALKWDVSENAEFNLLYFSQSQELGCCQASLSQSPSSLYTPVTDNSIPTDIRPPDLDDPSILSRLDPLHDRDFDALNMKLDVSFDEFDLSIMGSTKERGHYRRLDNSIWFGIYDDVTLIDGVNDRNATVDTFEVRLVSAGDGPIEWIAGVWYEDQEEDLSIENVVHTSRTDLLAFGCCSLEEGDLATQRDEFSTKTEFALYGELGYRISERAKLTVGYRRADLELDSGVLSVAEDSVFRGQAVNIGVDESTQEDIDTYKIHFEYSFNDDLLAYVLASSGYRAGGWNRSGTLAVSPASQYTTDTLWNYELGVRSAWLDGRLTANAVAYYIDWSDIQLQQWDIISAVSKIQNVGKAEIYGIEAEVRYQISDNFNISANYSHIDASLAEDFLDPSTTPPIVAAEKGDSLPGSSKNTFSLFVDWHKPLTDGLDLVAIADYRYTSSRPNILGLVGGGLNGAFPEDVPSAEVTNLSLGVNHHKGISLSLFANNVFDDRNIQTNSRVGTILQNTTMNRPRTLGIRAGYRF